MRVGLFTESYDPIINGVSTSVKTLAAELARSGHTPIVVAPRYAGFIDEPGVGPAPVRRLASWRTVFNPENPFAFPPLGPTPAALRGVSFDIVHTQQPFGIGLHGRVAARRAGVPLVSTFHTLYTEYTHYLPIFPPRVARWWLTGVLRDYYGTCDAVVVPSREAGRRLEALGVMPERLHVVPTGVPAPPSVMPAAVEQTRRTFSLPTGAPVLLYVGRLAREKNLDLLVDAFAVLCEEEGWAGDRRPILLLVGSGPYRAACEQRVQRLGIAPWVRFAGFLKRNQLAPVYAAATLFCFPSATETQGVVLSEAQSHGLPCVVVNGGGAPEFVRPNMDALLVPSSVDAFAAAVRELLTDYEKRRLFSAAALASPLRPTPEAMVRQVIALYSSLLGGKGQSGLDEHLNPLRHP